MGKSNPPIAHPRNSIEYFIDVMNASKPLKDALLAKVSVADVAKEIYKIVKDLCFLIVGETALQKYVDSLVNYYNLPEYEVFDKRGEPIYGEQIYKAIAWYAALSIASPLGNFKI